MNEFNVVEFSGDNIPTIMQAKDIPPNAASIIETILLKKNKDEYDIKLLNNISSMFLSQKILAPRGSKLL